MKRITSEQAAQDLKTLHGQLTNSITYWIEQKPDGFEIDTETTLASFDGEVFAGVRKDPSGHVVVDSKDCGGHASAYMLSELTESDLIFVLGEIEDALIVKED